MTLLKQFTISELSQLAHKSNLHLLIHGKVYDVHDFVHEHPGGDLVLLGEGGRDATKAWDDVQHSDEARELMKDYLAHLLYATSVAPDEAHSVW
ncbi:Cytochrome b5 [Vanrija pseudolonga]|uniref:Cytochrome b5 n=1 Tax=Vanrija pseudolonga TaxID=143232 RepID=A0AAF0Y7X6_9TREE|nr:Cytochrome b5 [Vanrija pseudolonga]